MLKKFANHFIEIPFFGTVASIFMVSILFTLSACSPHPAAGKWKADGSNSQNIAIINILFEGNADFYADGKEESIRRCFWSANAENTMAMQCVNSENNENKMSYQFMVIKKGYAELSQDSQLIGQFILQKPEKEASFY